jgi:hypothetical protein
MFVLVSTSGAGVSRSVETEIKLFLATNRPVIAIDLDGTIRQAAWWPLLIGLKVSIDSPQISPAVLERVENAANFTRRNNRLTRFAAGALIVFGALSLLSVLAGNRALKANAQATHETKAAEAAVEMRKRAEADTRKANATLQQTMATLQQTEASLKTQIAVGYARSILTDLQRQAANGVRPRDVWPASDDCGSSVEAGQFGVLVSKRHPNDRRPSSNRIS